MVGVLAKVFGNLFNRQQRVTDLPLLQEYLGKRAAFISQKCTVEYCRARAGLQWSKLMLEKDFLAAMEVCRWEAYSAVYQDVALTFEGAMRPLLPQDQQPLGEWLIQSYATGLYAFPTPNHRENGWADDIDAFRGRLARFQMAAPIPAADIGFVSGKRCHAVMPIHTSLTSFDRQLVTNNIRFNLVRFAEDMKKQADLAGLAVHFRQLFHPKAGKAAV